MILTARALQGAHFVHDSEEFPVCKNQDQSVPEHSGYEKCAYPLYAKGYSWCQKTNIVDFYII